MTALQPVDYAIIGAYLAAIVGMSAWIASRQRTGGEYFLAGRSMRGSVLSLSLMANQASAVSLVGAPAFVALQDGGGMRWLQYELALPLAMLLLVWLLLPALRSAPGASIYAYAERRFSRTMRRLLAGAFLLSRGLALGVILYASALAVAPSFGMSTRAALVAIGLFCVLYTGLGGIVADIWSDVLQLVLLWAGILVAGAIVLWTRGTAVLEAIPTERTQTLVVDSLGLTDGNSFALAPMLVGGLFLYMSYYGCDQTQAQRLLTARDDAAAQRALVLNGILRFPLVLTYCGLGLLLAGLLQVDPAFAAAMRGEAADSLVPVFLATSVPAGLRGLVLAGIFAAAMSSIDSALNSLAAVTLDDVLGMDAERQSVWVGRAVSLFWGAFAVVSGVLFAAAGGGVLQTITKIGSVFYGPIVAVFLLGALAPAVGGREAVAGFAAGFAANVAAAVFLPGLSWLWWNAVGCLAAMVVALAAAGGWRLRVELFPRPAGRVLLAAFVVMVVVVAVLPSLVR